MAKSIIGCADGLGSPISAGETHYFATFGLVENDQDTRRLCWVVPVDGVIRNLNFHATNNTLSGALTASIRYRRNDTESLDIVCSVAAGVDGWAEDTTHARIVKAGECLWFQATAEAGTGSANVSAIILEFEPDNSADTVSQFGTNSAGSTNFLDDNATTYGPGWGGASEDTDESLSQRYSPIAGVAGYMAAATGTCARITPTEIRLRLNGTSPTDGPVVTFQPIATNSLEVDKSNTVSVPEGGMISMAITNGAGSGEAFNWEKWQFSLNNPANLSVLTAGTPKSGVTFTPSITRYLPIHGQAIASTVEANSQLRIPANSASTVDRFYVEVTENGLTASCTVALRVDGVTVETITIPAAGVDFYEVDATALNLSPGDLVNAEVVTQSGGSLIRIAQVGIVHEITGTGGATGTRLPRFVQSWAGFSTDSAALVAAVTVDDSSTGEKFARPGNLLIANIAAFNGGDVWTPDAAWTTLHSGNLNGSLGYYTAYKIAAGDETDDISATYTDGARNQCLVREYDILDESLPFEAKDTNSSAAVVTTIDCGATGVTPGTSYSLVVCAGGPNYRSLWDSDGAGGNVTPPAGYDNYFYESVGNSRPYIFAADKIITTTGAENPTWSTAQAGSAVWAEVAVFNIAIDGAAVGPVEIYDLGSTVDLVSGQAEIAGSGNVIAAVITSSGALLAQPAEIDGTAEREITGQGSLFTIASVVSGSAEVAGIIDGAGALSSESASIAGIAEREINASGALTAESAQIDGTGTVDSAIEINGSGALVADLATISGSAEVEGVTNGSGDLVSGPAIVSGAGIRQVNGTGSLAANSAQVDGTAERQILSSGALESQPATIDGTGIAGASVGASGELQAQDSSIQGTATREITGQGSLVSAPAAVSGVGVAIRQIVGAGTLSANEAIVSGTGFRTIHAVGALQSGRAVLYGYDVFTAADWVYTVDGESRIFYVKKETRSYNVAKRKA